MQIKRSESESESESETKNTISSLNKARKKEPDHVGLNDLNTLND